jgi:hypothetical protein
MHGIDDRVEHPAAPVAPSCGVEGDGQLSVTSSIQLVQRADELVQLCAAVEPGRKDVLQRSSELPSAVAE